MSFITLTHAVFMSLSADARTEIFTALGSSPVPITSSAAASAPAPAPVLSKDEMKAAKKAARKTAKKLAKAAAAADPDAVPAEKRPPNAWILFSGRVEKVIREKELADGIEKEAKMRTVVVKQFAAALKKEKAYDDWAAAEILDALESWTPPPKIVPAAAAAGGASESDVESVHADATAADAAPVKKRGPKKLADMTDDERAAHDAKNAERKAKKAATTAPVAAAADV